MTQTMMENRVAHEFVDKLRRLLELEVNADLIEEDWEELSREFVAFVRSNELSLRFMDDEIWHYTADLGIRLKDKGYAARQRDHVQQRLEDVARGALRHND